MTRPLHREVKVKFDSSIFTTNSKMKPLTVEDNQHMMPSEDHFRSILRDTSVQFSTGNQSGAPPSFQEPDMQNWMGKKFKESKERRHLLKMRLEQQGTSHYPGTANSNTQRKTLKRKNSRGSTCGFTNVDVDYTGDSHPINHLLKTSNGGRHHPTNLNFEVNLRTYKAPDSAPTHTLPFKHPQVDKEQLKGV